MEHHEGATSLRGKLHDGLMWLIHRWPIHRAKHNGGFSNHDYNRFWSGGCIICRTRVWWTLRGTSPAFWDAFDDESRVEILPASDDHAAVLATGIVARQLADLPEADRAVILDHMRKVATDAKNGASDA